MLLSTNPHPRTPRHFSITARSSGDRAQINPQTKPPNNFTHAVAADTTFTVTAHAGSSFQLGTLVLTNGGTSAVTWPDSFKWADGVPPSLMAGGVDVITFFTIDGGETYYAAQVMTGVA